MKLEQQLCDIFGADACITDKKRLGRYRLDQVGDEAYAQVPAAVVFPSHTEQVVQLMRWANRTGTAVTPRGGGTGLAGAAIPVSGGVVCAFERMDQIIEIDIDNLMVVTQPGVVTSRLDEALKPHGLFFAGYRLRPCRRRQLPHHADESALDVCGTVEQYNYAAAFGAVPDGVRARWHDQR